RTSPTWIVAVMCLHARTARARATRAMLLCRDGFRLPGLDDLAGLGLRQFVDVLTVVVANPLLHRVRRHAAALADAEDRLDLVGCRGVRRAIGIVGGCLCVAGWLW